MAHNTKTGPLFSLALIVSALGFFVDVFDLLLFAIVRKPSLASLGLAESAMVSEGEFLISIQMMGMLIGGIVFGIIGDKKGRLSVLFGSILLYSLANIANAFITNIDQYIWLRFIAGLGLAGELGAGITLVSEQLPKEKRSLAAGIIAGFGVLGAVVAYQISELFSWQSCYLIGGGLGLILLVLRLKVTESDLFKNLEQSDVSKGNFLAFFTNKNLFLRYIKCVLIGLPVWYVIGILVTFSDKFGEEFGTTGIKPGLAIMYLYLFVGLGDVVVGWLSERLKSRKKTLFIFYGITILFLILFFLQSGNTSSMFYTIIMGLGFGIGFNVIYLTLGVEQFGTNLRASAAVSIPNMVRGSLPLLILLFQYLRGVLQSYTQGAIVTAFIVFAISIVAALSLKESYGTDLDFLENEK
jgi:MFS transporter, putative metabolite:H+ symporter